MGSENGSDEGRCGDDNDDVDNADADDAEAGDGSGANELSVCAGPGVGRRGSPPALLGRSFKGKVKDVRGSGMGWA